MDIKEVMKLPVGSSVVKRSNNRRYMVVWSAVNKAKYLVFEDLVDGTDSRTEKDFRDSSLYCWLTESLINDTYEIVTPFIKGEIIEVLVDRAKKGEWIEGEYVSKVKGVHYILVKDETGVPKILTPSISKIRHICKNVTNC